MMTTRFDLRALDSVGAMIIVLDSDDRIAHWNRWSSHVMGYTLDEVVGRNPGDFLLSPEATTRASARCAVTPFEGRGGPFANNWTTKSGEQRWIVWSSDFVEGPAHRPRHVIWTAFDATECKRLEAGVEEELAQRAVLAIENARLIADAQQAAADLREANQQMVAATLQAQEQAEQAVAARERSEKSERELQEVAAFRERFIGILAHDLRTPLSAIAISAASLLRSSGLGEKDREKAGRIIKSSERMTRMISQLLDLTRARLGGGFPLDPRPSDLGEVCRGVAEELGAAVELRIEGPLVGNWDPDRLAEVIANIAGNAIEHAAPGTNVLVSVRTEDGAAVVEIANQGEPIPADLLPFIFEPFRQSTPRKQRSSGNLGLGLYIAKQIVLAAGGTLDARSSDGTTTFVVRLPRAATTSSGPRTTVPSFQVDAAP